MKIIHPRVISVKQRHGHQVPRGIHHPLICISHQKYQKCPCNVDQEPSSAQDTLGNTGF